MKTRFTLKALSVFAALLVYGSLAHAQATRTWVSGVGDDVNPCSRTAPCKTFAGAISKTAAGGEINIIDAGAYGAVTITKSITISAEGGTAGVLYSGINGIVVNAAATDVVVLRGLDFEGGPTASPGLNGIRFLAGAALVVEHCILRGGSQKGIDFQPSGNAQLYVHNTTIFKYDNATNGGAIFIKPGASGSAKVVLDNVRMERSFNGIRAEDRSSVAVHNSVIAGNTNNGVLAASLAGASADISVHDSVIAHNGLFGVRADGAAAAVRIGGNTISYNGTGLSFLNGGQIISFGTNHVSGNTTNGAPSSTPGRV